MSYASVDSTVEARCAYHIDRVAIGTCDRCGSYYCPSCVQRRAQKQVCSGCLALPGVDYLAELRAKTWGKRDGWVWYLGGLITFSVVTSTIVMLAQGAFGAALVNAGMAVLFGSYFLLQPWSRRGIFAALPLAALSATMAVPAATGPQIAYYAGAGIGRSLVLALFLIAAYRSTRNKLAFKIEVSDDDLAKYYDTYVSNPHASRALAYGLLSLAVPLLIPVAIGFGVHAYRKADPNAWPPVGRRASAVIGLALGALSTVIWTIAIIGMVTR